MRPLHTTLIMGFMALATSVVAAIYYPWPTFERTSERINKPLFPEFDPKQVRTLEVMRLHPEKNVLERILLERRGEKWTLPNHAGYSASNAFRIAAVINNVADCTVLELETDKQLDHLKFGVLDIDEPDAARNPGGIGWKVALRDRNQRVLASLIVGHEVAGAEGRQKRFVRVPGEPQVYVVNFDVAALSTYFRDWIDPNLLQLQAGNAPGDTLLSSYIHSYRIDPESLKGEPRLQSFYEAEVTMVKGQPQLASWLVFKDGTMQPATAGDEVKNMLQRSVGVLPLLFFVDVRLKDNALAEALKKPHVPSPPAVYESALSWGFKRIDDTGGSLRFLATGGRVDVRLGSGIRVAIYLGNIVPVPGGETRLARVAMLVAEFDESQFPRPQEPVNEDGAPLTDEQRRSHARELEQWDARVKQARQQVDNFNLIHATWYYALDEDIVNLIRPELPTEP